MGFVKNIKWYLFKALFSRQSLFKTLKGISDDEIVTLYQDALDKQEYEVAAILKYYTEFKRGDHER